jgi:UPF0755 protein
MSEDDRPAHDDSGRPEPYRHVRRPRPHGRRARRPEDQETAGQQSPEMDARHRSALEDARRALRERRDAEAPAVPSDPQQEAVPAEDTSADESPTEGRPDAAHDDHSGYDGHDGHDGHDDHDDHDGRDEHGGPGGSRAAHAIPAQDESLEDEAGPLDDEDEGEDDEDRSHPLSGIEPVERRRRSPLHVLPIVLVLVVVVAVGAGAVYGYSWLTGHVSIDQAEQEDYSGSGSDDEVVVEVSEGDTGSDIAATLVDHDVIKAPAPFVRLFGASQDASQIQPGSYRLNTKMSSASALDALQDPSSLTGLRVTIPEGMRSQEIYERISKTTDIPVEDFEKAAKHYTDYGIPKNPADSPEGYLWPGRYDIPEDATAGDVLTMMWEHMDAQLDDLGVEKKDRHRVLTLASIAEKEAKDPDDYGKVVRTLENRMDGVGDAHGKPMKLQLDSTVAYLSKKDSISTTPEQRAKDSPYNTYKHEGLPVGPISNPGRASLEAAVDPPEGTWLYWVTTNTETGETAFADTYSEHEKNVKKWQDWAKSRDAEE